MNDESGRFAQRARQAISAGDFAGAEILLLQCLQSGGNPVPNWLNVAAIRRQRGDIDGAFQALREVLTRDTRNFPALLMNATLLEKQGQMQLAAATYASALANAPENTLLDAPTRQALDHGRDIVAQHTRELDSFIRDYISASESACTTTEKRRIDTFIRTTLRTRPRYRQEPVEYFYPGLPSIEFYDRAEFDWLPAFEGQSDLIRGELEAVLREDDSQLTPYIRYDAHLPLDQWRELNHSPRWSAWHLYDHGLPIQQRWNRVPATVAALSALPQARVPRRSPSALFSVLAPKTRIPAHHGVANFRLVVHLPLILPGACGFRVGGETREWRYGEAWVFDDTIEHEAWNDSDQVRVIFICDIWSPRLSPEERQAIAATIEATDQFSGVVPSGSI